MQGGVMYRREGWCTRENNIGERDDAGGGHYRRVG